MPRERVRYTREQLYDRVWTTPLSRLGPEMGLSDRGLAKRCRQEGIPVPPRGYWAKLQHGKAPKRTPLPKEWPIEPEPLKSSSKAVLPSKHPLLADVRVHFEKHRLTRNGYLRPYKRLLPDLFVTEKVLSCALDFANSLYLTFEKRKYPVGIASIGTEFRRPKLDERDKGGNDRHYYSTWQPDRPTVVYIDDVAFGLTIYELSQNIEVRHIGDEWVPVSEGIPKGKRVSAWERDWTTWHDNPTGRLCLRAYSASPYAQWQQEWREKKPGELTKKCRTITTVLKREAPAVAKLIEDGKRRHELEKQRWEEERREWKREQEENRKHQAIEESRKELFQAIEAWGEAKRIEGFFEDAEQRAAKLPEEERQVIGDRIRRARELVGNVDALRRLAEWKTPDEQ